MGHWSTQSSGRASPPSLSSYYVGTRTLNVSVFLIVPTPSEPASLGLSLMKVKVKSLNRVRLFATPWTVAYQAPLSMGFSRQEYWSGLPFPSPGESSRLGDRTRVSLLPGRRFNRWAAIREVQQLTILHSWFTLAHPLYSRALGWTWTFVASMW